MCRLIEQQVAVELTAHTSLGASRLRGFFCWQLPTSHPYALPLMSVLDVAVFFTMGAKSTSQNHILGTTFCIFR
jgi:hypothetical protein